MPPAFTFPRDKLKFLKFKEKYPEKIFMQKDGAHRGFKMIPAEQVEMEESVQSFVQVLKEKLLVIRYL